MPVTAKKSASVKKPTVAKKPAKVVAAKVSQPTAVAPKKTSGVLAAALKQAEARGMQTPTQTMSVPKLPKLQNSPLFLLVAWILVLSAAAFYFRGQFIVATVNGQPIFRTTLVRELESQSGRQVLDDIVLETLVRQEAAARKITVSDQEVDAEIKNIESRLANQKQELDQLLKLQGMTMQALREQVRLQAMVDKMIDATTMAVTDDEVKKYIEDNKAFLPKGAKPEELAPQVKAQLEQQKTSAKTQEFLKSLQSKAKVSNWMFKD